MSFIGAREHGAKVGSAGVASDAQQVSAHDHLCSTITVNHALETGCCHVTHHWLGNDVVPFLVNCFENLLGSSWEQGTVKHIDSGAHLANHAGHRPERAATKARLGDDRSRKGSVLHAQPSRSVRVPPMPHSSHKRGQLLGAHAGSPPLSHSLCTHLCPACLKCVFVGAFRGQAATRANPQYACTQIHRVLGLMWSQCCLPCPVYR